nr:MAG TPA: hypothetical protein [Caudoviricetes sp.]
MISILLFENCSFYYGEDAKSVYELLKQYFKD